MKQEFTSANTSINKNKLPSIFTKLSFPRETTNLDLGGGKYDNATKYLLDTYNVENLIYDPYNRSEEHNENVLRRIEEIGGVDSVTLSNVLNVIKEKEVRQDLIRFALDKLKYGGKVFIKVYEGNKSGVGKKSKNDCWQTNMKTKDYLEEIEEVHSCYISHSLIVIQK